jgi:alkaline phosphatase D
VAIDGMSEVMTVTLKDMSNTALWSVGIPPEPLHRIGPA